MPAKFDWFVIGAGFGAAYSRSKLFRTVVNSPVKAIAAPLAFAAARAAAIPIAGYALGAAVGTGVSHLAFGESGAQDAIDLYTNPKKFWKEAYHPFAVWENVSTIVNISLSNRDTDPTLGGMSDWMHDIIENPSHPWNWVTGL